MRKFIILIFIVSFHQMLFSQENRVDDIRRSMETIAQADSTILALFPTSFKEYQSIWGYDGPLCDSFPVVFHLWYSDTINKDELQRKILSVCFGGKWEADHVSYLIDVATRFLSKASCSKDTVNKSIVFLNSHSYKENVSFWRFIFDGPHPENRLDIMENIRKEWQSCGLYKYMSTIEEGYQMALLQKDDH